MQAIKLQGSPLSTQQAHLWPWQKSNQVYRTSCAIQIQGACDRDRLKQAFEQVIARNEILRTVFHSLPGMDIPMQVISDEVLWSYHDIGLEQLTPTEQRKKIDELFASLHQATYDLLHGPLVLAQLCLLHAEQQVLLLSLPAFCADNASLKLLIDEFSSAYRNDNTVEDPLQYADVSAWQEEQLGEDDAKTHREYWRKIDLSHIRDAKLPFHYETHHTETQAGEKFSPHKVEIALPDDRTRNIVAQAQQHDVSVSAWLLTCWNVLLWRLCGETSPIGVACDGRNNEDLIDALGPYTRFVPLTARFEEERPFALVVASINAALQEAIKRQLYFTWEQDQAHDDAAKRVFPVLFEYEAFPASLEAETLTFSLLKHWSCTEPFSLKLSAWHVGEQLQMDLYYDPLRMTTAQINSLASLFQTLLEHVTKQPQSLLGTLPLLSPAAREYLRSTFSGPQCSRSEQGLHQLFEAQVLYRPDELAVISRQEQLTYRQLNAQANRLAAALRRRGAGPNMVVGLCLSRQASMLAGLLGILKTGAAYMPLDAASPQQRLSYQLQESGVTLLVTQEEQREHLPVWTGHTLWLEEIAQELVQASPDNQAISRQGDALAYVIYTSGSTGAPKGVMVLQRSVVNYTLSLCEQLGAQAGWQFATVSTLAADLGNTAIFCALASGGCVQVLDYDQVTSVEAMAEWAQEHPIDVLKIVPSHLSALLESERGRVFLPRQALVLGGEALSPRLLRRIGELDGTCQVYNHYGPTETTIGVLLQSLGVQPVALQTEYDAQHTIALGRPIANTQVYVLDEHQQMVPQGVRGELYIGGAGVARGYVGQGGLTAGRFVPDPYHGEGMRLYRTGDLALYGQDGLIEFMGRADGQVKLRGYRVELGEIETVLRQHPQVRESVVVFRSDGGDPRLVGYVVSHQRGSLVRGQLDKYMQERLPDYMVPTEYIFLEEWPLTANGKIDRQHLPKPEQEKRRERRSARSPIEELVTQVWQELLGAEIGIHENFFEAGGHSLLATRVMARIRTLLPIDLPVRAVFEAPTVAEFAQRVEQALRDGEEIPIPPLEVMERPAALPLSYAQHRLWFLDQLEPESTAYLASRALVMKGALDVRSLEQSLQELINRHESLRTTFTEHEGQPIQIIHQTRLISLPIIDLQGLSPAQRTVEAQRLASLEAQSPCDLVHGPLLRTSLLRLEPQEHRLLFTLHHIITDGWSNEIIVREFATLYQAYGRGLPSPLPPLVIQYADYALWQRGWLQGEILASQLSYWKKQLANVPSLELPIDYPRVSGQAYRGAVVSSVVPEDLAQSLIAFSQQESVTLFMLLLTAFQVLLMGYTGQTDISVGTPIANRTRSEIEGVVGFFVNTLVMRADLSGNPSFQHLLQQVRETCLEAYAHQDVPFEKLVEALQPERDLNRSSLFQTSFQFSHDIDTTNLIPGLSIEAPGTDGATADYDFRIMMIKLPQGFSCVAFYDTNLFEEQTIKRLLEHFQILLQGIVLAPEKPIAELPLLSERERQMQLVEWNATQSDYPHDQGVHQLFEQQVQRTPDAVALVFEELILSYAQLNRRANQLAHHLQAHGVGPDVLVGICLPRSPLMVIGLLGILKAGGAYVPLDPGYPQERLAFMVTDAHIPVLLTAQLSSEMWGLTGNAVHIDLQRDWPTIALESHDTLLTTARGQHLAYMIYTSGSTGTPKGTMVTHRNVINFLFAMNTRLADTRPGRWLAVTSISFDISVLELFWTLSHGFNVVLQADSEVTPSEHNAESTTPAKTKEIEFSLFYFANVANTEDSEAGYKLLLEGAQYADQHGFTAVWTPERHFHEFGGLYPNPSVISAALAALTRNIQIRAGSVVLPLHHPARVAEEWALVDQLSHGRTGIAFASGWNANDFTFAPEKYAQRKAIMARDIETVRALWRGESVMVQNGRGEPVAVSTFPRPIQAELPVWITSSGSPETFQLAGASGANVLTHLLGQDLKELKQKIAMYHEAWHSHGHDVQGQQGHVTLMVHTFLGTDRQAVRETVRKPFSSYLRSSVDLKSLSGGLDLDPKTISEDDIDALVAHAFERYVDTSGLMGTVESCLPIVEQIKALGIDEIACLIDFGVATDEVLASLQHLTTLKEQSNSRALQDAHEELSVAQQLIRSGASHLQCTPSLMNMLLQAPEATEALPHVQHILLGGEALPLALVNELQKLTPATIYNMYGPTETTIWSSISTLPAHSSRVDLGQPIANTQIYILDRELQPTPIGVAGELYISGDGVVRGYLKRPELTAERFLPDPWSGERSARMYRTGDLARYRGNGALEYLGRVDEQIKLRGFRIELGEIEAVLRDYPMVQDSVVILREDRPGDTRLVAYIILNLSPNETINQRGERQPVQGEAERLLILQIREYLRERLPEYMVPAYLVFLDAMPLTPNGKLNRRALPVPEIRLLPEQQVQSGPETPIEELIGELWSNILGRSHIGMHENFFELGGHSLLITQLVSRIRSTVEVEMPVRVAFEVPTIAQMARWIEQALRKGEAVEMPPLKAVAYPDELPLSFAQQRLWFLEQLTPNSTMYLNSGLLSFRGILNCRALEWSIQEIVRRHESLRTTFAVGSEYPVQIIHPIGRFTLPIIDLSNLKSAQRTAEAQVLAQQESQQPCDFSSGPLFRVYLLRLESQEHQMVLTQHHIISDGWSNNVLVRELTLLYQAFISEQPSPLVPLQIQYADYALWQRHWLQGEILQKHISYWQQQLRGVTPLILPADAPRTAIESNHGARYSFELATDLAADLEALSRREGATMFMTLLAAFQILLYRISGQPDIVVGTDVANRTHVETEKLIGFFVNLLAMRTNMRGAPSFRKVVQKVRSMVLGAYTHQEMPFELVIEHVQVERKENQTPLVQVLFVMQNVPISTINLPGLELETIYREESARFDIALFVQETPTGISGSVVYRAELFKEQTIAAWMHQFDALLRHIVAQPDMAIDVLELYTAEEKALSAKETLAKSQAHAKRIRSIKGKAQHTQTALTEEHKLTLPPETGNAN